jgi:uncharacterized protein
MLKADDVINLLKLEPHPVEGGYFREIYRSTVLVPQFVLKSHSAERQLNTAIYYLLSGKAVSEMHRLPGDEIYHFYMGDPLETLLLKPDGSSEVVVVGNEIRSGHVPQLVIPAGVWQGSVRKQGVYGFTLIGATMAPGFAYEDYEQGVRDELVRRWPKQQQEIIARTPRG